MTSIEELLARPGQAMDEVLKALRLDVQYDRAEGNYLFTTNKGKPTRVLDVVGGFGVGLFGHYHPRLTAVLEQAIHDRVPFAAQGSIRREANELKQAIREYFGPFDTVLTNSGTETVEAAIKHAFLESGRTEIWAVRGAYHGKTLGSLSLMSKERYSLTGWTANVRYLDPTEPDTWPVCQASFQDVAAIIFEPIQGEGGVRELPQEFCQWLMNVRSQYGIRLIADEIQCGLGRTGSWLASSQLGISPDYICLGKALGAGLVKIGALLIHESHFRAEFRWQHTSTFAEDGLSCRVAQEVLALIAEEDIALRCGERAGRLNQYLSGLRETWPNVISDCRGRGLMLGLELADQSTSPSNAFRLLSRHGLLGYVAASYCLNRHQVRIAPTISSPHTIRLQPSVYFSNDHMEQLVNSLSKFCEAIDKADAGHVLGHILGREEEILLQRDRTKQTVGADVPSDESKVAFIAHPLQALDLKTWDASLEGLNGSELSQLAELGMKFLGPGVYDRYQVRSITGKTVHLSWIGLLPTSEQMIAAHRERFSGAILKQIETAIELAFQLNCQTAGLGGYNSIVTFNCQRVRNMGIGLTSGNALTVAMCLRAAEEVAARLTIDTEVAAVVGAGGNIGSVYSKCLASKVKRLYLITRRPRSRRAQRLLHELEATFPKTTFTLSSSMDALRNCQLIVGASNSPTPVIFPRHIGNQLCVICDVALPSDVSPDLCAGYPNVTVIQGGIVRLPLNNDLKLSGLNLPAGRVFACIGETLLMGLAEMKGHGSYGDLTPESVQQMLKLADEHGFQHEIQYRRTVDSLPDVKPYPRTVFNFKAIN